MPDRMVAQFAVTDYPVDMDYDELRRRLDEGYGAENRGGRPPCG